MALVGNDRRAKADQRHNAAQKQVDLVVLGERVERAAAHQAVIGVVFHNFHAHPTQKPVVSDRRRPLENRVRFAGRTHAVNDVAACLVLRDEPVDRVHIILQIGVE